MPRVVVAFLDTGPVFLVRATFPGKMEGKGASVRLAFLGRFVSN